VAKVNKINQFESALIVPVPEAEQFVSDLRIQYDPSAAVGVPAHITINYPFTPYGFRPEQVNDEIQKSLSGVSQFTYNLGEIRTFPEAVFLFPQPEELFISLINAVFSLFPESPPYKGEFPQIIPHLTIAQITAEKVEQVKIDVFKRIGSHLPIRAIAREVWIIDNSENTWKRRKVFTLNST